jgi:hypothetical protein
LSNSAAPPERYDDDRVCIHVCITEGGDIWNMSLSIRFSAQDRTQVLEAFQYKNKS